MTHVAVFTANPGLDLWNDFESTISTLKQIPLLVPQIERLISFEHHLAIINI